MPRSRRSPPGQAALSRERESLSSAAFHQNVGTAYAGEHLGPEPRGLRIAATRQRADDDPVGRLEFGHHAAGRMTQPPGHPVSIHRAANGFRNDEANPG